MARCCLEQAGELDGALQTCSEVKQAIGASMGHSEATGELLESVQFADDRRKLVLLTERCFQSRTRRRRRRSGGDDSTEEGEKA